MLTPKLKTEEVSRMSPRERIYHYRGGVERGARYEWRDGYSQNSAEDLPLYPWSTRSECRAEAKKDGYKAVFYRDGKPEPTTKRRRPVSRQPAILRET
jgi:hypothetical protein